jgi:hypothetical protein
VTCVKPATTAIMIVVAALVVPVTATPAGAAQVRYSTIIQSRPIEPYAQVPSEVHVGVPSASVYLEDPATAHCEVIAGVYDHGLLAGEYLETIIPDNMYRNPTQMRAVNPRDTRPDKAEFTTFPGGPSALAECPTPTSGKGSATWGGGGNDSGGVESATSTSTSTLVPDQELVVSETTSKLQGVKLGDATIRSLENWLKVEWRPDQEPVISYRMVLQGVFSGTDEVASGGGKGIVLSGQNVGGSEFTEQFNQQAKAHQSEFEQLGTYGFRILEPRYYEDAISRRPSVEAAVLDASWGFTARQGGIGHRQGLRLGVARAAGRIWQGLD